MSYIHFYYGDGKGKTTAAMGLAIRALGHDIPVTIVQFLKTGNSGECKLLESLGAKIIAGKLTQGFSWTLSEAQKIEVKLLHNQYLTSVQSSIGLLVLDEVGDALSLGLLDEALLLQLLNNCNAEIVLTGHKPIQVLLNRADYITEMKAHRHPYQKGVPARIGIEY